jgi:flagellar biosynthesis protein FliP
VNTGWLGVLGALAITFGLLALALQLLRRIQSPGSAPGSRIPLQVLQRVPVGPKQGVALVRVSGRVLIVSVTESQVGLLGELSEAERSGLIESAPRTARPARAPVFALPASASRFRFPRPLRGVSGFLVLAALALVPVTAGAAGSPAPARAASSVPAPAPAPVVRAPEVAMPVPPRVEMSIGDPRGGLQLSGGVGVVVFLGALTLLPAMFLLMTSFTRILIVLHFLRSALGTQTTPPGQLLVAIAVLLTGVVMNPTLQTAHREAIQPYFDGRIGQPEAYQRALVPFREFMLSNAREKDLALFAELSRVPEGTEAEALPLATVVSAFVTSELRTAFQMGFVIFLPFIVVDVIVASVLMSLGMFMLPPMMISLPFKLLLFVLADGWTLVVQNLVASFR